MEPLLLKAEEDAAPTDNESRIAESHHDPVVSDRAHPPTRLGMSRRGGVADPMLSAAVRARMASAATAATAQALTPSPRTPLTCAVATDVPVVFLYFADYLYAQDRSVKGLRIAPVNDPPQRFWNVEDWYVKTAVRR